MSGRTFAKLGPDFEAVCKEKSPPSPTIVPTPMASAEVRAVLVEYESRLLEWYTLACEQGSLTVGRLQLDLEIAGDKIKDS